MILAKLSYNIGHSVLRVLVLAKWQVVDENLSWFLRCIAWFGCPSSLSLCRDWINLHFLHMSEKTNLENTDRADWRGFWLHSTLSNDLRNGRNESYSRISIPVCMLWIGCTMKGRVAYGRTYIPKSSAMTLSMSTNLARMLEQCDMAYDLWLHKYLDLQG